MAQKGSHESALEAGGNLRGAGALFCDLGPTILYEQLHVRDQSKQGGKAEVLAMRRSGEDRLDVGRSVREVAAPARRVTAERGEDLECLHPAHPCRTVEQLG